MSEENPRIVDLELGGKMKIVGRRWPRQGDLEEANRFLKMVIELRGNKPFIPRGVHRFKSHDEKDTWTLKMLIR